VVSPILVDDDACGYRDKDCKPSNHDVGLGFTVEDLLRWQDQMARGIDPSRNGF
jgi:hypothetical protein